VKKVCGLTPKTVSSKKSVLLVKMAANSGGVDWGSVINPIVCAALGDYRKIDSVELAKSIIKRYA